MLLLSLLSLLLLLLFTEDVLLLNFVRAFCIPVVPQQGTEWRK